MPLSSNIPTRLFRSACFASAHHLGFSHLVLAGVCLPCPHTLMVARPIHSSFDPDLVIAILSNIVDPYPLYSWQSRCPRRLESLDQICSRISDQGLSPLPPSTRQSRITVVSCMECGVHYFAQVHTLPHHPPLPGVDSRGGCRVTFVLLALQHSTSYTKYTNPPRQGATLVLSI